MNDPFINSTKDFTIEAGCPWHDAQQTYGAPNINWCEPSTCGLISEPANSWSNLGFFIIAIALLKKMHEPIIRFYALTVMVD